MKTIMKTIETPLTRVLNCPYPIISAGMGGPARSALAAAVSRAGGFGLLGMVRESAQLIAQEITAARRLTNRPFGVNLIPSVTDPRLLAEELAACFAAQVPVMCFFWDVMPSVIRQAKDAGCLVLHQVGSLDDALQAEAAGADVVIVQGVEAGGHVRGRLPLSVLLPQIVGNVKIPVVASGGIMTGRDLAAALAIGADGVQCGTAFLASTESFAHDYHKQRLIDAKAGETVHTDLFAINWPPNSPVRVLKNSLTEAAGDKLWGYHPDALPREVIGAEEGRPVHKFDTNSPLQNMTGDFEKFALYAGEGVGRVTGIQPVAEIIEEMMGEAVGTINRLSALIK